MAPDKSEHETAARPRFRHGHRRRPLRYWVLPLLLVVALMIMLPRLVRLLEG